MLGCRMGGKERVMVDGVGRVGGTRRGYQMVCCEIKTMTRDSLGCLKSPHIVGPFRLFVDLNRCLVVDINKHYVETCFFSLLDLSWMYSRSEGSCVRHAVFSTQIICCDNVKSDCACGQSKAVITLG